MKPVDRGEILGLAEYETVRERFRARVIAEKKLRRVQLGPKATAFGSAAGSSGCAGSAG